MSFFSRLTSFVLCCKNRAFRLRQERTWNRLSPEGRERLSALLRAHPEHTDFLWHLADRLSRTEAEWSIDVRRAARLAVVEIRFPGVQKATIRLLPHSQRRFLSAAERAETESACLYRFYFAEKEDGRWVQSPRRSFRRAGK